QSALKNVRPHEISALDADALERPDFDRGDSAWAVFSHQKRITAHRCARAGAPCHSPARFKQLLGFRSQCLLNECMAGDVTLRGEHPFVLELAHLKDAPPRHEDFTRHRVRPSGGNVAGAYFGGRVMFPSKLRLRRAEADGTACCGTEAVFTRNRG